MREPIEVFELVGAAAAHTRFEAATRRGLTPFVGRSAEMEQLRDALDQASRGRGQVVGVVSRNWQDAYRMPVVAAALGAAYALAGRAEKALTLVAGAVEEFHRRQIHFRPAFILLCAGMTYLSAGRINKAADHARESLSLARRLGAPGSEAHALCLNGDVASKGGIGDPEDYYRQALVLGR